jgi:hypothetical protein
MSRTRDREHDTSEPTTLAGERPRVYTRYYTLFIGGVDMYWAVAYPNLLVAGARPKWPALVFKQEDNHGMWLCTDIAYAPLAEGAVPILDHDIPHYVARLLSALTRAITTATTLDALPKGEA